MTDGAACADLTEEEREWRSLLRGLLEEHKHISSQCWSKLISLEETVRQLVSVVGRLSHGAEDPAPSTNCQQSGGQPTPGQLHVDTAAVSNGVDAAAASNGGAAARFNVPLTPFLQSSSSGRALLPRGPAARASSVPSDLPPQVQPSPPTPLLAPAPSCSASSFAFSVPAAAPAPDLAPERSVAAVSVPATDDASSSRWHHILSVNSQPKLTLHDIVRIAEHKHNRNHSPRHSPHRSPHRSPPPLTPGHIGLGTTAPGGTMQQFQSHTQDDISCSPAPFPPKPLRSCSSTSAARSDQPSASASASAGGTTASAAAAGALGTGAAAAAAVGIEVTTPLAASARTPAPGSARQAMPVPRRSSNGPPGANDGVHLPYWVPPTAADSSGQRDIELQAVSAEGQGLGKGLRLAPKSRGIEEEDLGTRSVLGALVYKAKHRRQRARGAAEPGSLDNIEEVPGAAAAASPTAGSASSAGALGSRTIDAMQTFGQTIYRWTKAVVWEVWEPDNCRRMAWDMLMLLTIMYVTIVTPYLIAFQISTVDLSSAIGVIDMCVNGILMMDVCINFRTAYPDAAGNVVLDHKLIALNYLQGWFWLDVLTSLPYDNMFSTSGLSFFKLLRLLRIFRFIHVLRMIANKSKLRRHSAVNIAQLIEITLGRARFNLLRTFLFALALLHWASCLFYFAASWEGFDDDTWVYAAGLNDAQYYERYIYAFYWATVTMATVGYGDIIPVSTSEHCIAVLTIFIGTTLFAFVMGSMASYIASSDSVTAALTRKRATIEEFLKKRNVPRGLSDKVLNYYNYTLERAVDSDEQLILDGLSRNLQLQVVSYLYRGALEKVPMFRDKHPQFIANLVPLLKLEYYSPEDVVVRQGDVGHEMYFVVEGELEVRVYLQDDRVGGISTCTHQLRSNTLTPEARAAGTKGSVFRVVSWWSRWKRRRRRRAQQHPDFNMGLDLDEGHEVVGTLTIGDHFGWHSCMLGYPRSATVVTHDWAGLYSLKRSDLENLVSQWPELAGDLAALVTGEGQDLEKAAWDVRKRLGLPTLHDLQRSHLWSGSEG